MIFWFYCWLFVCWSVLCFWNSYLQTAPVKLVEHCRFKIFIFICECSCKFMSDYFSFLFEWRERTTSSICLTTRASFPNVQLHRSLLREVCVRCFFPLPFTELLSVSWKKILNESVIFMSDLLCCFFCVFEVLKLGKNTASTQISGCPVNECYEPSLSALVCMLTAFGTKRQWFACPGKILLKPEDPRCVRAGVKIDNYRIRTCAGNSQ